MVTNLPHGAAISLSGTNTKFENVGFCTAVGATAEMTQTSPDGGVDFPPMFTTGAIHPNVNDALTNMFGSNVDIRIDNGTPSLVVA